jgi:hypothetical protein
MNNFNFIIYFINTIVTNIQKVMELQYKIQFFPE